jgi:nicotinate-nucleotide adenylyltransferase
MRIGILGGTFDPFHNGHLETVLAARKTLQWDRVLVIPAWRQPFKAAITASGYHRFAMAVLATEGLEEFFVAPLELERGAVSYSVDTLEWLRMQHQFDTLDWIIGDDNLASLTAWKSIDRLFALANFVVLSRELAGVSNDDQEALHARLTTQVPTALRARVASEADQRSTAGAIVFAENPTVPISSTEIRRRIRAGEPIDSIVDPRVAHYIHHYGLYREVIRERSNQ